MNNFRLTSDEELLLLARKGNTMCRNELDRRYCSNNRQFVCRVMPDAYRLFNTGDINSICFITYLKCVELYRFGTARFKHYYEKALGHGLAKLFTEKRLHETHLLSLDQLLSKAEGGSTLTLHDVVPSDSISDNPRAFIDYFEEVMALKCAPKSISALTLKVAELRIEGRTFKAISKQLGISQHVAFTRYQKYEEEVQRIIARGTPKKTSK